MSDVYRKVQENGIIGCHKVGQSQPHLEMRVDHSVGVLESHGLLASGDDFEVIAHDLAAEELVGSPSREFVDSISPHGIFEVDAEQGFGNTSGATHVVFGFAFEIAFAMLAIRNLGNEDWWPLSQGEGDIWGAE